MKKFNTIVTTTLLAVGVAYGEDSLSNAFKEGKWSGRIRFQDFVTNWDSDSKSKASGAALGGSIVYKSGSFNGFALGAGLYTTQNAFNITDEDDGKSATTSKDLFCRDQKNGIPVCEYGDGYTVLAQLYLQYNISNSTIKAGRFLANNPWITPNDTKMIPIATQGIGIESGEIQNTVVQFDYIDKIKERGNTYFGNMADTGDTPVAIRKYYATHYYTPGKGGDVPGVAIFGATNRSFENLELQAYGMYWDGLVTQARVEANYAFELGESAIMSLGIRYMHQFDQGAGDIIKPKTTYGDSNNDIDSSITMARAVLNYKSAKLLLALSKTDNRGDILAPWRGFPTDGYTRSTTQTDWNAGTKAYKIGLDYDWDALLLKGVTTSLSYSKYNRDESKIPYQSMTNRLYGNGDTTQYNFDIIYKPSKSYLFKIRMMDQRNDLANISAPGKAASFVDTSNKELRVEANYYF